MLIVTYCIASVHLWNCTSYIVVALPAMGHWGTCRCPSTYNSFIFSLLCSKSKSQLSKYCV